MIVIGGDHSVTFGSILYDLKTYGEEMGVIHFDSHGEVCLYKESPSKNFHGMYLRIFFDKFDIPYFDELVPTKLPKSNLFFVGDLEIEDEEKEYIENNFQFLSNVQLKKDISQSLSQIKKFIKKN